MSTALARRRSTTPCARRAIAGAASRWARLGLAALILAGILAPAAAAQTARNPPVVAVLCSFACPQPSTLLTSPGAQAFLGALRDAGFVDGKTVVVDYRASGVAGALPRAAADVTRRRPAVILAVGDDAARAARKATAEIPIVMVGVIDPVETGMVASLGRPGGNVTGVGVPTRQLATKQIGLLREIVPGLTRVAVLVNPANPAHGPAVEAIARAVKGVGVSVQTLAARGAADFEAAFAAIGPARPVGLVVLQDDAFTSTRGELTRRAQAGRIPLVADSRTFVEAAGLLAYGPSWPQMFERAGVLVARVLRGERPGNLPVEEPTRYRLLLNLSTAKVLGLTVPQAVLAQVDEVLQ
jgi:putative ABC transport system substrate-binding protein